MIQFKKKKQKEYSVTADTLKVPRSFLEKGKKKNDFRRKKVSAGLRRYISRKTLLIFSFFLLLSLFFILSRIFIGDLYISPLPFGITQQPDENKIEQQISAELKKHTISYARIIVDNSIVKIVLDDASDVYLSSEKDIQKQIASLQFILSRLTMEGRRFKRLDLRFENPVIVMRE